MYSWYVFICKLCMYVVFRIDEMIDLRKLQFLRRTSLFILLQLDVDYHNDIWRQFARCRKYSVSKQRRVEVCLVDVLPASLLIGRVLSGNWVMQDTDVGKLFSMSGLSLPVREVCQTEMRSAVWLVAVIRGFSNCGPHICFVWSSYVFCTVTLVKKMVTRCHVLLILSVLTVMSPSVLRYARCCYIFRNTRPLLFPSHGSSCFLSMCILLYMEVLLQLPNVSAEWLTFLFPILEILGSIRNGDRLSSVSFSWFLSVALCKCWDSALK